MCGSCQRDIDQRFIFTFLHLSFSIIELQVLFISFFFHYRTFKQHILPERKQDN